MQKEKSWEKKFLHRKKDCETVIGYTFRVGYIYRADFKLVICIDVLKVSYLCWRRVYVDYFFR
jgi:hypothetical protein